MNKVLISIISLLNIVSLQANWQLDNSESQLWFITTKATHIAESNQFTHLSGNIQLDGNSKLVIDLASVDSFIDIRDQRMKEHLFNTDVYPVATYTTHIDPSVLANLNAGDFSDQQITGTLDLHGDKVELTNNVRIVRLHENELLVLTLQPIIIQARQFSMLDGVEKLRELANLPDISYSVPISFVLTYKKEFDGE